MKPPVLLLLLLTLFIGFSAPAQTEFTPVLQEQLNAFGYDQMSQAGKDSLYANKDSKAMRVYFVTNMVKQRHPALVRKQRFSDFFEHRLSKSDFAIGLDTLDKQHLAETVKTRERGERYLYARNCQQSQIDSLTNAWIPILNTYVDTVFQTLSKEQFHVLTQYWKEAIEKLHRKRDEFLDFEKEQTYSITPHIYDYLEWSFGLMDKIPSSDYYNLLGANKTDLNFISGLALEHYFERYAQFENQLINVIYQDNCKAHFSFPYYGLYRSEESKSIYQKRNALLYAISLILNNSTSNVHKHDYKKLDLPDLNHLIGKTYNTSGKSIWQYLDTEKLSKNGIEIVGQDFSELGIGLSLAEKDGTNLKRYLGIVSPVDSSVQSMLIEQTNQWNKDGLLSEMHEQGASIYYYAFVMEERDPSLPGNEMLIFSLFKGSLFFYVISTGTPISNKEAYIRDFMQCIQFE
jgi:hypothetical protein